MIEHSSTSLGPTTPRSSVSIALVTLLSFATFPRIPGPTLFSWHRYRHISWRHQAISNPRYQHYNTYCILHTRYSLLEQLRGQDDERHKSAIMALHNHTLPRYPTTLHQHHPRLSQTQFYLRANPSHLPQPSRHSTHEPSTNQYPRSQRTQDSRT